MVKVHRVSGIYRHGLIVLTWWIDKKLELGRKIITLVSLDKGAVDHSMITIICHKTFVAVDIRFKFIFSLFDHLLRQLESIQDLILINRHTVQPFHVTLIWLFADHVAHFEEWMLFDRGFRLVFRNGALNILIDSQVLTQKALSVYFLILEQNFLFNEAVAAKSRILMCRRRCQITT